VKPREGCSEVLDEDRDNVLIDYDEAAEPTLSGKYRCRDCGKIFDTLEELDLHRRMVHARAEVYPLPGMPM